MRSIEIGTEGNSRPKLSGPHDRRLYALGQAVAGTLIGTQMALFVDERRQVMLSVGLLLFVFLLQYLVRRRVWSVPRHVTKLVYAGMATSIAVGLFVVLPILRARYDDLSTLIFLAGIAGIAAPSWGTAAIIARDKS